MSTPGSISAGLAYLPDWLNDCRDAAAVDRLLCGWVAASRWRSAGFAWSDPATAGLSLSATPTRVERGGEFALSGSTAGTVGMTPMPNPAGRMTTLLAPPGREPGLIWAERNGTTPWSDDDRNYLKLSARLIERSPALAVLLGPAVDPERLSQRLADAAVIAGRMAHEFDNILTGIIGFSDLSLPLLPAGSQAAKYSEEISKVGQRGVLFTQQLHELSRSGHAKPQPGSVPVALATQASRLAAASPAVEVASDLAADLVGVAMEAGPLGMVLGHLLANAAEAMPAGGRAHVVAEMVDLSAADARGYLGAAQPGRHVRLTVRDAGPGIKPDVRARLFNDPFFTTKVRHRGLGLAVVYRSLCAHRGGIRIEPNPPTEPGTTVRVVLPPAAVRVPPTPAVPRTPPTLSGK